MSVYWPATLLPLPTETAYSCFMASQPSAQLDGLCPAPGMRKNGYARDGGCDGERRVGLFALNVGPTANLAKLLGNNGFPGTLSPTGTYGVLLVEWKLLNEDDLINLGRT